MAKLVNGKYNHTVSTTLSLEEKHYFDSAHLSDDEPEAQYVEQTIAKNNDMNNIIEFNQQQLKSIHKQIVEQDRSIAR